MISSETMREYIIRMQHMLDDLRDILRTSEENLTDETRSLKFGRWCDAVYDDRRGCFILCQVMGVSETHDSCLWVAPVVDVDNETGEIKALGEPIEVWDYNLISLRSFDEMK